ncbi:MAG: hypothetical protein AAF533_13310 [Acidobacteriota bacterium]
MNPSRLERRAAAGHGRRGRRMVSMGCVLAGLLAALPARAGAPVLSGSYDCNCESPTGHGIGIQSGQLTAFKVGAGFELDPDVLFGQSRTGGDVDMGGVHHDGNHSSVPLDGFTQPWSPEQGVIVYNVWPGTIYVSSYRVSSIGDRDLPFAERIGSLDGYPGPVIETDGDHPLVTWNHFNEKGVAQGCRARGGDTITGFLIGYNLYRLSRVGRPFPSLREFLVDGSVRHLDLATLDFTVVDPSGAEGSDLDASDGLSLRNPDGIPHSGDEVLVFEDTEVTDPENWWWRLQPVVRGNAEWFETGLTAGEHPAQRLDLDSDGFAESVDVMVGTPGFVEFIDPTGHGLGLTFGGEILSSLEAGSTDIGPVVDDLFNCIQTESAAPTESACDDGVDDDEDGLVDCDDPDCADDPDCDGLRVVIEPPDGGRVLIGWDETSGTGPYLVVVGNLTHLLRDHEYSHQPLACGIEGTEAEVPLPEGDATYFLVQRESDPGPGADSSGTQRPPASGDCP